MLGLPGWWELGGSELGCRVAGGDAAVPWLHPGLSGLLSGADCLHQPGITVLGCSVPLRRGDAACLGLGRGAACVGALGQHPAARIGLGQLHPAREREGEGQKGWEPVCSQGRKCQGWAAGWIRASSGRRVGREREDGSVVHLSFTRGLSTSIQLETCRAMRPDPEILTASAHPPMASGASPPPSPFASPVPGGPLGPAEPCRAVMADCVGSPSPRQPWRGIARNNVWNWERGGYLVKPSGAGSACRAGQDGMRSGAVGAWGWGGLAPMSLHGGARGIAEGAEETAMLVIKRSGGTEEIETTG